MKVFLTMLLILGAGLCFSQGDLLFLKNNFYFREYYRDSYNCDSLPEDGITSIDDRICANIKLQEADSILKMFYDSVRMELLLYNSDSLSQSFELLQKSWRQYRDAHCEFLYGGYETSTGAVLYMNEMRYLTNVRIEEMKGLLRVYRDK
ncbi:MAG: lysozyme inhibitor LprI family protein [Bacteroidia bacterium]